jgi:hypothetical protein
MRPDSGSDPLAASDRLGKICRWLSSGVSLVSLQDAINNIWNNNITKKTTMTLLPFYIKGSGILNTPATSRSGAGHVAPDSQAAAGAQASLSHR